MNELCDGFVLQLSATKPSSTGSGGRGSGEKEEITKVRTWPDACGAPVAHYYMPRALLSACLAKPQPASVSPWAHPNGPAAQRGTSSCHPCLLRD